MGQLVWAVCIALECPAVESWAEGAGSACTGVQLIKPAVLLCLFAMLMGLMITGDLKWSSDPLFACSTIQQMYTTSSHYALISTCIFKVYIDRWCIRYIELHWWRGTHIYVKVHYIITITIISIIIICIRVYSYIATYTIDSHVYHKPNDQQMCEGWTHSFIHLYQWGPHVVN